MNPFTSLFVISTMTSLLIAQSDRLLHSGDSLWQAREYDSAYVRYQDASNFLLALSLNDRIPEALHKMGKCKTHA